MPSGEGTDHERPTGAGQVGAKPSDVFAEDWWTHARPVLEIHGYFRVRAELFHNFALGRSDNPLYALWAQPPDNSYRQSDGTPIGRPLCGPNALAPTNCQDKTQAGANLRFRVNPELHISDNLRVISQIDLLDNVVMGSTPDSYAPGLGTSAPTGYAPIGALSSTQTPPTSGLNSIQNSIAVKRAWGEYVTPVGQLRFGRMPDHWGLGMLANSGDGYDSDYQTTTDRIQFISGIKSLDLYFGGSWDFVNEGASSTPNPSGGQPYDLAQLDDVNQYTLVVARRRSPALAKRDLARGEAVINGGAYFLYRDQLLASPSTVPLAATGLQPPTYSDLVRNGYVRRGFKSYTPDLWFQLLYRKFRFEAEGVMVAGSIENTQAANGTDYANLVDSTGDNGHKLLQFGLTTQTEFRAIEDRLKLQFGFGWASGDPDYVRQTGTNSLVPSNGQLPVQQEGNRTFSEFRFHPDYRIDLIFFRNILSRVEGAYYFRPSAEYDFSRSNNGQRFGGGAAAIWSRASEFIQTPGHKRDLGVELDLSLYYQAKDGSLNDDHDKMGGFFTMVQYGVFFPLGGLGYLPGQTTAAAQQGITLDTGTAQTVRWYMGILY